MRAVLISLVLVLTLTAFWLWQNPPPPMTGQIDQVRNLNIKPGQKVISPLALTGEVCCGWYFEGSFPAKITDERGKILGQAPMQAQDEWMTADFVPFRGHLTFSPPATKNGYLILEKDNPAGQSERAASVSIFIRFR